MNNINIIVITNIFEKCCKITFKFYKYNMHMYLYKITMKCSVKIYIFFKKQKQLKQFYEYNTNKLTTLEFVLLNILR